MKELSIVCLAFSIVGILILSLIPFIATQKTLELKEIKNKNLGEYVLIRANITSAHNPTKDFYILNLTEEDSSITGILFSDKNLSKIIIKNNTYLIEGRIETYNSILQININKIVFKND